MKQFRGRCFNCGRMGHRRQDCPDKGKIPQQQGQKQYECVYDAQQIETQQPSSAIDGTFLLPSIMGHILFNTGASHCFIDTHFARALGFLGHYGEYGVMRRLIIWKGSLIFFIHRGVGI